jgi:hypothetical protein
LEYLPVDEQAQVNCAIKVSLKVNQELSTACTLRVPQIAATKHEFDFILKVSKE